jgi:PilZ domain-containing protein
MASLERPDGEQRPALVHDLSESGALLLVRTTKIGVDDEVALHLHATTAGETPRDAQGVVVRVEELAPGDSGPWLRRVAVRFREPLPMVAAEIEGFRLRAQRLGIAE